MTERAENVARASGQPNLCRVCRDAGLAAFSLRLPAHTLNVEGKSRSNLFPWRGQFSPQLVEVLLRAYAAQESFVLDPFMGSGTVLVECARLGMPVHGCEVNPAAFLLARIYEFCNLDERERRNLLQNAESILAQGRPAAFELPLFRTEGRATLLSDDGCDWIRRSPDPRVRMLLEALVVLADGDAVRDDTWARKWSAIRSIVSTLPFTKAPVRPWLGDARSLPLPDHTIDFVLSSPPYINVFNYHHNLRAGIESLGWKPLVVSRSEIGSNRKFRQNRFLTVVQYCIDMTLVLAELHRVCKDDARILLILGRESNVHKTPFYNGRILESLATEIFDFRIHLTQERVFVNRFGQDIYEDILHLSPPPDRSRSEKAIVECARRLSKDILSDAVQRTPKDRMHYLRDAISRVDQVPASPILKPAAATGDPL
jgi:DNA modification methylase